MIIFFSANGSRLLDRTERAAGLAGAALDAFIRVDVVRLFQLAGDGAGRAVARALRAALHTAGSMTYVVRLRQLPVRHFLSKMCSRYSSSKFASVDSTGFGAVLPRPHREEFWIILARERSSSMSPGFPLPW